MIVVFKNLRKGPTQWPADPVWSCLVAPSTLPFRQFSNRIDIDLRKTMKSPKRRLSLKREEDVFPIVGQKLIYSGKVLHDDTGLKVYQVDEETWRCLGCQHLKLSQHSTSYNPAITSCYGTTVSSSLVWTVAWGPTHAPASAPSPTPAPLGTVKQENPTEKTAEAPVAISPPSTKGTSGECSWPNCLKTQQVYVCHRAVL